LHSYKNQTKPIIIDCDPGLDDAIALMVAFGWRDQLDIKGITCVAGNQTIEKTFTNALRIAKHLNIEVPIARGAEKPLIKPLTLADDVNGQTGLEGMEIPLECVQPSNLSAFDLISEILAEAQEKVTILATAPLTNIAHVLSVRPHLKNKIDHITLMGGSSIGGNITAVSEFNMFVDPEAAKIVFDSGVPITMFGLDLTYKAYTTRQDIQQITGNLKNRASRLLGDLLNHYMPYSERMGLNGVAIHDACTVIYELKAELFSGIKRVSVDVDTSGGPSYGSTLVDFYDLTGRPKNVDFITQVDQTAFNDFLYKCCARYLD
jgi:pyrimidine-specific ribonucleoside hydrolase